MSNVLANPFRTTELVLTTEDAPLFIARDLSAALLVTL
jgi:hypothetical protein